MEGQLEFEGTDRFKVISRLGVGGMGAVYHVVDHQRSTRVALKTLGRGKGDALWRFKNEFRSLQGIDHPNLVTLGELIESEGQWFFTMELITGVDFLSYVCPGSGDEATSFANEPTLAATDAFEEGEASHRVSSVLTFDEIRLRRALGQLCAGVHALHDAGHVHRDIKPDNVIVEDNGRVVVIDFGLVADIAVEDPFGQLVGTAAYMAPEQVVGTMVGPPSDWYAVGVTLYEALTNELPFDGSPTDVLMAKQDKEPTAPSALATGVPPDLEDLCMALLRTEPARRPGGEEILRRLHVHHERSRRPRTTSANGELFGRASEMRLLEEAKERSVGGESAHVVVYGASGMGKSRLVADFERMCIAEAGTQVFRGRCYEQESVPYKAFDGVMDQLSWFLRRLGREEVERLLPAAAGELGRSFPVLRRVPQIDDARPLDTPDPLERRRQLFAAVRELFARLGREHHLVLSIDDAQWSDEASRLLLEALTRPPDPPPCLIVLTERTAPGAESVCARWFAEPTSIEVGPLGAEDALNLAQSLLRAPDMREHLEKLVAHADGHPIFLEALVRHLDSGSIGELAFDLDGVLLREIERLDHGSRALLEVICVAGLPVEAAMAANIAEVPVGRLPQHLRTLRVARLVRSAAHSQLEEVEPYHAKIRDAAMLLVTGTRLQGHHRGLARALERGGASPERIAGHYERGAQPKRAMVFLLRAAQRSEEAYAFDQAARLYERALRLGVMTAGEEQDACVRLGDALASAGRGKEAARAYRAALDDATPAARLELKRKVAEQLLTAGFYREGVEAGSDVMNEMGVSFPTTSGQAFRRLAWLRIRIGLRGYRFTEQSTDELSPSTLARIDACWHLSRGFAAHDVILAQVLQCQALLYALDAGEPLRIAKGLCYEYLSRAIDGPESIRKHRELVERARVIADDTDDPNMRAAVAFAEGMGAHTAACHFTTSAPLLEDASRILRARCTDVAWERSLADEQRLLAYYWLGRWPEMARDCPELCAHAENIGNEYWVNRFAGSYLSFVHELDDDVSTARRLVARGEAALPDDASAVQRFGQLWCATRLDLYELEWESALERMEGWQADFLASFVLKVPLVAFTHQFDIGRVYLAAAGHDEPSRRHEHLARVRRAAKQLAKVKVPFSRGVADALLGAAAACEERPEALTLLAGAVPPLREHGLAAVAAAVSRRHGQLLGGEEGARHVREAERWFTSAGVRNVGAMATMLLPS